MSTITTRTPRVAGLMCAPDNRSTPVSPPTGLANLFALESSYSPDFNVNHIHFYDDSVDSKREGLDDAYKDPLVKQAVTTPLNDALSEWREIEDPKLSELDQRLRIKDRFIEAGKATRKYGTSMIVPILVSNGLKIPLHKPLEVVQAEYSNVSIDRLLVLDAFKPSETVVKDILHDRYGEPTKYSVSDTNHKTLHGSRVIVFGDSDETGFIEGIIPYVNDFHDRNYEVTRAVQESNVLILKTDFESIQDYMKESVSQGVSEDIFTRISDFVANRLQHLRENANNENAYAIDKETEEIEQITKTNISAMVEAVRHSLDILTAMVDIPQSRYLGNGATSLSGNSTDIDNYVQTLNGMRSSDYEPPLRRLDHFIQQIYPVISSLAYDWNPLAIQQSTDIGPLPPAVDPNPVPPPVDPQTPVKRGG